MKTPRFLVALFLFSILCLLARVASAGPSSWTVGGGGGASVAPPLGGGTLNTVTKWTPNGTTLGNSVITDDGNVVAIGPTTSAAPGRDNAFAVTTAFNQVTTTLPRAAGISSIVSGGITIFSFIDNSGNLTLISCNNGINCASPTTTTLAGAYNNGPGATAILNGGDGVPIIFYRTAQATLSAVRCTTAICTGLGAPRVVTASFGAFTTAFMGAAFVPSDGSIAIIASDGNAASTAATYIRCLSPTDTCVSTSAVQSFSVTAGYPTVGIQGAIPMVISGGLPVAFFTSGDNSYTFTSVACNDLTCATPVFTRVTMNVSGAVQTQSGTGAAVGPDGNIYFAASFNMAPGGRVGIARCGGGTTCTSVTVVASYLYSSVNANQSNVDVYPLLSGRLAVLAMNVQSSSASVVYYVECLNSNCSTRSSVALVPQGSQSTYFQDTPFNQHNAVLPDGSVNIFNRSTTGNLFSMNAATAGSSTGITLGCLACGPGGIPLTWGNAYFGGDVFARNLNATGYLYGPIFNVGQVGVSTGVANFNGATAGTVTVRSLDTAGTWTWTWPNSAGVKGQVPMTDGLGGITWANKTQLFMAAYFGKAGATLPVIADGIWASTTFDVPTTMTRARGRLKTAGTGAGNYVATITDGTNTCTWTLACTTVAGTINTALANGAGTGCVYAATGVTVSSTTDCTTPPQFADVDFWGNKQ